MISLPRKDSKNTLHRSYSKTNLLDLIEESEKQEQSYQIVNHLSKSKSMSSFKNVDKNVYKGSIKLSQSLNNVDNLPFLYKIKDDIRNIRILNDVQIEYIKKLDENNKNSVIDELLKVVNNYNYFLNNL